MFEDLKNNIDFYIREKTRFSRKNFVEKNEAVLYQTYLENLYVLDVLSKCFSVIKKEFVCALDIGSKNWYYANAEYSFLKSNYRDFLLKGVELDAYRLYSNFYSRYEAAKFYTKNLKNTEYVAGNLLNIKGCYDYITWFLPFVLKSPLKCWGLPEKFFMPETLLKYAYSILGTNGQMLIINQGEKEAIEQKLLLDNLQIPYTELGIIKSEFFEYKNIRYGFLIRK